MKQKHINAYMKTAEVFAECSESTRLKVGAVIVKDNRIIGVGYNAQPKQIEGPLEGFNNETLPTVRHAEKSALMGLLRAGISPIGATLFCTHSCCEFCAIDVIDAGIKQVFYRNSYRDDSGLKLLQKEGILVEQLNER